MILVRTQERRLRKIKGISLFKLDSSTIWSFSWMRKARTIPSTLCRGHEWVEFYLHSRICLRAMLRNKFTSTFNDVKPGKQSINVRLRKRREKWHLLKQRVPVLGVLDKRIDEMSCRDIKLCATSLRSHKFRGFMWQSRKLWVAKEVTNSIGLFRKLCAMWTSEFGITRFAPVTGVVVFLGGMELVKGRCDLDYCTSTSAKWCTFPKVSHKNPARTSPLLTHPTSQASLIPFICSPE